MEKYLSVVKKFFHIISCWTSLLNSRKFLFCNVYYVYRCDALKLLMSECSSIVKWLRFYLYNLYVSVLLKLQIKFFDFRLFFNSIAIYLWLFLCNNIHFSVYLSTYSSFFILTESNKNLVFDLFWNCSEFRKFILFSTPPVYPVCFRPIY